ncbi:MAG: MotA/TolQ/ExbB proton channel family protein [Planctomycetes bacterium]|nr:MotA/TolQ/ExbB proton channel family protein [Planctomycetota bacterium]
MVDIASVFGLFIGFFLVALGILQRTSLSLYLDLSSVYITFGGAFSATILQFSAQDLSQLPGILWQIFWVQPRSPRALIREMVGYAEIARRDGILALEGVTEEIRDDFLVRGLQLAVDGTDPESIQQMLITELENLRDRHERARRVFDALATYLPAFGMIGTVIGLVAMLRNLHDPKALGPAMATALLTTLYGALGCYLVAMPIARKLDLRSREETLLKEMIIRGVMSIQSGDNPRIVEQKLRIYLPPKLRQAG